MPLFSHKVQIRLFDYYKTYYNPLVGPLMFSSADIEVKCYTQNDFCLYLLFIIIP